MRTVTSDCLADKFGGRLKISTIRLGGWLRGSNRRPLGGEGGTPAPGWSSLPGLQKDRNGGNVFPANLRFWQPLLASQLK